MLWTCSLCTCRMHVICLFSLPKGQRQSQPIQSLKMRLMPGGGNALVLHRVQSVPCMNHACMRDVYATFERRGCTAQPFSAALAAMNALRCSSYDSSRTLPFFFFSGAKAGSTCDARASAVSMACSTAFSPSVPLHICQTACSANRICCVCCAATTA